MLGSLFLFFLKLGFLSFGGGYPLISFIMSEGQRAVGLTANEFADMLALELLAAGPVAINSATYVGYIKAGIPGAAVATAAVCLPGFTLSIALSALLRRFRGNRCIDGALSAIKVACGGMMLAAALKLADNLLVLTGTLREALLAPVASFSWAGIMIVACCFLLLRAFRLNPVAVIGAAAVMGAVLL